MPPNVLLPETDARQDGVGPRIALKVPGQPLLLTLAITRNIEQADLMVSVWGSADGKQWQQLTAFPRKSYCGTYSTVLDLSHRPEMRHLRAQWTMNRWGGADHEPLFGFCVSSEAVELHAASIGG